MLSLDRVVPPTPLLGAELRGRPFWIKAESLQPVGAFKIRGAWHRLSNLSAAERTAGVVAFSSGNHAQGVAWAARRLGMPATIVMPSDAPEAKLAGTRALGAKVHLYERAAGNREAITAALAAETGATIVPPFDDPWIIEGQGGAALEAATQLKALAGIRPARFVVPCGGGGLAAGSALAVPEADIVFVEPEGWDDMGRSLALGEIVPVAPDAPPTLCDALKTLHGSPLTLDVLRERNATALSASDEEIKAAMRWAFSKLRLVIEPGGAAGLAAIIAGKVQIIPGTIVVASGGNVDARLFAEIIG